MTSFNFPTILLSFFLPPPHPHFWWKRFETLHLLTFSFTIASKTLALVLMEFNDKLLTPQLMGWCGWAVIPEIQTSLSFSDCEVICDNYNVFEIHCNLNFLTYIIILILYTLFVPRIQYI